MNFIPTIIIALDPYSTRLLTAVRDNLQQRFPSISLLIQFHTLIASEGKISSDLDAYAAEDFDMVGDRPTSSLTQDELIANLEQETIALLRQGLDPEIIAKVEQTGITIRQRRRIYCFATAAYPANRDTVPHYGKLLRFLLNRLFIGETNHLELITLLPSLFDGETPQSCADTYGFLKVLDHHLHQSHRHQETMLFDNHWLIDRTNSENIQMPSFQSGLDIYVEALSIFLVREAEARGIPVGDTIIKGKVAAFSSFGCSEALFPIQEIIEHLWMTLATDILDGGLLPIFEISEEHYRRLLLDAKAFVLQREFSDAFNEIKEPNGRKIWQDFMPSIGDSNLGFAVNLIQKLNHKKKQFCEQQLLSFKQQAEEASHLAEAKIKKLLETEVAKQSDTDLSGLDRARQFLNVLADPAITRDIDILGEEPQNLVVSKYRLMSDLDSSLDIHVNHKESKEWLQKIQSLKLDLTDLENIEQNQVLIDISQKNPNEIGVEEIVSATQNKENSLLSDDQSLENFMSDEEQNFSENASNLSLSQQIFSKREELERARTQFLEAIISEELVAQKNRQTAIENKRQKFKQAIDESEKKLSLREKDCERYQEKLDEALEQQRNLLLLYLFTYFVRIVLAVGILSIALVLISLLTIVSGIVVFGTVITLLIWGLAFLKSMLAIKEKIRQAKKQLKNAQGSLKDAAIQLRRCHNEELKFEFDVYVQRIRGDVADYSIQSARQLSLRFTQSIGWLNELRNYFQTKITEINIPNSLVRSSIISVDDIHLIYQGICAEPESEASRFTIKGIRRSQILAIKPNLFQQQLKAHAQEKFKHLKEYSLGDVFSGKSRFQLSHDPSIIWGKFYRVAQPLVKLFHPDMDQLGTNVQDMTMWIHPSVKDDVFSQLSQLGSALTDYPSDDRHSFTLLGRQIGFPAYFLSSIEYYRLCYEKAADYIEIENHALDDLLPNYEFHQAWQILFMAIALDLITFKVNEYQLSGQTLGKTRRAIAESLTREYSQQALFTQLESDVEIKQDTINIPDIYNQLLKLSQRKDWEILETSEQEILDNLLHDYDPLN